MQPQGGPIRVLHVDDDPDLAEVAATFLERQDDRFAVEIAASAREGRDRLDAGEFDCVISDYDMPGRNGIEFLEAVREEYPDLPFVLYTGKGSEEVASDAISAGVTDYLQKERGTSQYEVLANRVRNAVEQYRATQRAAELDRIRTLASDVNQALIRADSREETETRVCEIVSDSDPYLFAWIGGIDPDTDRVTPRAAAGVDDGYLEAITVTADDAPTGQGPAGTAVREGRLAVSQNVGADPDFEPWREAAIERGYRSVAAVPLAYRADLYGALVVYADRPNAFDEDERELLVELGDDVAHALHSFDVRRRLRTERDRRQALFANAPGPVIASEVRPDGAGIVMTDINEAFEEVFGYDTDEVVGRDPAEVIVPAEGMERHEEFRERSMAGETVTTEVERITTDGPRTFILHIIPFTEGHGRVAGMYAWYTDISERRGRERVIEELHRTTDGLMEAETATEIAEITANAVRTILGLPANGVHLYDESEGGLVPATWTPETEAIVGEPPTFSPGEGIAGTAYETGEPQVYDDVATVPDRFNPDTDVRSQIVYPLGDHGVLVIGSPEPGAFDDTDVSLVRTLAGHATAALDRVEREGERTRRRELFEAILETSIDGILVVDENREYVTWNQRFVDMWGIPEDLVEDEPEEVALEFVLDQLEDPDEFVDTVEYLYEHPDEESRDEIRLADGRVFDRYSAPVEADDGTYFGRVWFFRDVTERERREGELARHNERLERFASVVGHDLRNPLRVAQGRIELAREGDDGDHLDSAAGAVDRSLSLLDDLLTLARDGERVGDVEPVDLAATCEGCWRNVETGDATLRVETDRTVRADPGRLEQLVENLLGNAVEHGGEAVTVTVGGLDDGFYVADDGPGIPPERRERVFDVGYTTGEERTGFGLNIVREIADAHGWTVRATGSETGGARFEITGVEFETTGGECDR